MPNTQSQLAERPELAPIKADRDETQENELFLGEVGVRRMGAYTMRVKSGASYRDIARAYKVSVDTAYHDVQAIQTYFRQATYESIEDMRQMQSERLDILLFAHMPKAKLGDLKATEMVLRIEKRRAELLGLDAPRKLEMTGKDGGPMEMDAHVNIREKWTPQEAAARATELVRRIEVINLQARRRQLVQAQTTQAGKGDSP